MFDQRERKILGGLKTPEKIQQFLDNEIRYNVEPGGDTCYSPRTVLRKRVAHCMEGAMLAAVALRQLGHPPLLVDLEAVRDVAKAALYLKLEPQFTAVGTNVELPEMDSMGGRWERYLADQDLTGLDRDRVRRIGLEYLDRAVEAAG